MTEPGPEAPLEERQRAAARRTGCLLGAFTALWVALFLVWKLWP